MSALPNFALRPLAFPSHCFAALVDLSTGRVVAFQRAGAEVQGASAPDLAGSGGPAVAPSQPLGHDSRLRARRTAPASATGNASPATASRCRPTYVLASTARPHLTTRHTVSMSSGVALLQPLTA